LKPDLSIDRTTAIILGNDINQATRKYELATASQYKTAAREFQPVDDAPLVILPEAQEDGSVRNQSEF
jgi:hypothetical protein